MTTAFLSLAAARRAASFSIYLALALVAACGDDGGDDGGGGGDPLGVTIVAPADGDAVPDGTLTVQIETSGAPGRVAFLVDDVERGDFAAGTFPWTTSSFSDGPHTLVAEAFRGGQSVRSAPVEVTVDKVAPTLVGRAPEAGSDVFDLTGDIVAEFDEPVRAADPSAAVSVIAETRSCEAPPCAELPLDVEVTFERDSLLARLVTFPPGGVLPVDLRVRVGNGVTDLAGNPLVTEGMAGSWVFGAPAWIPFGARVVLGTTILESADGPTLTVGPLGTPYVLWPGSDPVDLSDDVRLFAYRDFWGLVGSVNGGVDLDVEATDLAVNADGDVFVAFGGRRVADGPLVVVRRQEGAGFVDLADREPFLLADEPAGTQVVNLELAVGPGERGELALMIETLAEDTTRRVRVWRHNGTDWIGVGGDVPEAGSEARLAVDDQDRALVASLRPVEGSDDADVVLRRFELVAGVGSWVEVGRPLFHGGGAFAFAVDADGRPFLAVRDGLSARPWILEGDDWQRLPGAGIEGAFPALAFDASGALVLGTSREAGRWEPDGASFLFDSYGDAEVEEPPQATAGMTLGLAPDGRVLRGASDFQRELRVFRFNEPIGADGD